MLSGRYRTDKFSRHWSRFNPDGFCQLPGCGNVEGSLLHILLHCPALSETRSKIISHWTSFLVPRPWLFPVIQQYTLGDQDQHLQLLLDPSVLPLVISYNDMFPDTLKCCLYLARTWNFSIHLTREKLRRLYNLN